MSLFTVIPQGPLESKCRKQLSPSSCGWVLIRSGQFIITVPTKTKSSQTRPRFVGPMQTHHAQEIDRQAREELVHRRATLERELGSRSERLQSCAAKAWNREKGECCFGPSIVFRAHAATTLDRHVRQVEKLVNCVISPEADPRTLPPE